MIQELELSINAFTFRFGLTCENIKPKMIYYFYRRGSAPAAAQDDGWRTMFDYGFWIMDFQLFFLSSTIYNSTSIISLDMAPPFQSQRRTVKGDV